jgi:hypothetical protein
MLMRVERRVGAAICVFLSVAGAVTLPRPARGSDGRPAGKIGDPEVDGGSSQSKGVRVGALGGVGFPRPLAVEAIVGFERMLAIGAEYSFLPPSTIGGVDLNFHAVSGDARIFPFGGPFFIGFRGGLQSLGGSMTATIASFGTLTETMTVDTWFINPRIGALFMWNSWLAVGFEAGVQIPLSTSTSSTLPSNLPSDPRITTARGTLNGITDTLGSSVIPTLDLLRIGLVL